MYTCIVIVVVNAMYTSLILESSVFF